MACNICSREFHAKRKPICASCTAATLYEPRIRQTTALIDRETSHAHVEAILRPGNDGVLASLPQNANWDAIATGIKKESRARLADEVLLANQRLILLKLRVDALSGTILRYRDHVHSQTSTIDKRREDLRGHENSIGRQKSDAVAILETTVRKSGHRLHQTHQRLANARASLCCSAASLAGLKQETDYRHMPTGRVILGGLTLPDLRELSALPVVPTSRATSEEPSELEERQRQTINTCLANTCRLIATWTHYLAVSTPAELILPHNDFPHPAILPEKSSYKSAETTRSQANSPSASRLIQDGSSTVRPRYLHLDRPLPKLAKEDPKLFGLFVEGIMLLAWDIAWLCKSQGVTAINTFDEVCDIGRSLLLFHRTASSKMNATSAVQGRKVSTPTKDEAGMQFGVLTHGTVLHSLAGYEGALVMQNWRLLQPHRLIDKLRSFLLTELTGAEWDVLSEHDYDNERDDEKPVLVGGNARRRTDAGRADMSVMSIGGDVSDAMIRQEKGWMRVRGRPTDAQ